MNGKQYNRIMPGRRSAFFEECLEGGFIGGDWDFSSDLSNELTEDWHDFNAKCIPIYLANNPGASKIAAGLACGMLWTISKGLRINDIVLMPDGHGTYAVGTITSDYYFAGKDEVLPHRRRVDWNEDRIPRSSMSQSLKNSSGSIGTCCDLTSYADEINRLINPHGTEVVAKDSQDIFALEKHLEDFLVANWKHTEFGKNFDIYEDTDGQTGQQYPTDTGPMDILAISKDKKELLVVELKRSRTSDAVVGQILRYMGFVKEMLCDEGQTVRGAIVALEDDQRIRRALSMVDNVSFFRYKINFRLEQAC